jgi:hypothetical protein
MRHCLVVCMPGVDPANIVEEGQNIHANNGVVGQVVVYGVTKGGIMAPLLATGTFPSMPVTKRIVSFSVLWCQLTANFVPY